MNDQHWLKNNMYVYVSMELDWPLCSGKEAANLSWMVKPQQNDHRSIHSILFCFVFILIALLPINKGNINCLSILHFCLFVKNVTQTTLKCFFPLFFRCCLVYYYNFCAYVSLNNTNSHWANVSFYFRLNLLITLVHSRLWLWINGTVLSANRR